MGPKMQTYVHPNAIIHKNAKIGRSVRIGPFCVIGDNVVLHDGVCLHSHVVVEGPTSIGNNTEVFQFSVIGTPAQHTLFKGEPAELIIGDNNIIREKVSIHRGTKIGGMKTIIGNNNFILADCHIAHDCHVGDNNILANGVALGGHVTLGNNCNLGAFSAVQQFVRIGDVVMIGAMAKVTEDIIPYTIADGSPCRLRRVNTKGLQRQNYTKEQILRIRGIFKLLFNDKGEFSSRVMKTKKLSGSSDMLARNMLEFINLAKNRPICKQTKPNDVKTVD